MSFMDMLIWLVFEGIGYVAKLCRAEPLGVSCHFIRIYTFQRFSKGPKVFDDLPKLSKAQQTTEFNASLRRSDTPKHAAPGGGKWSFSNPTLVGFTISIQNISQHYRHSLLVGGLEHEFYDFPYIGIFIIPTDFHIFQRGRYTTNQIDYYRRFKKLDRHLYKAVS